MQRKLVQLFQPLVDHWRRLVPSFNGIGGVQNVA